MTGVADLSGVMADPDDVDESSKADDAAAIGVAAACCLSEASENLVCKTHSQMDM